MYMASAFHARLMSWRDPQGWQVHELPLPKQKSDVVHVDGSGRGAVTAEIDRWRKKDRPARTTRGLFGAFVSAVGSGVDPATGGAPQLVGLFRRDNGRSFGVLFRNQRFLYGMPVHELAPDSELAWRNELFELASGVTKRRLPDAQPHGGSAPART